MKWDGLSNNRLMPWKGEKDPYKIWISEIILQQTRVEQGLSYYNRFIFKYPTLLQLAVAPENEVYKMWEGLGYYSRCRNLIKTAKLIRQEYAGIFPSSYEDILKLHGVGPYTAAAISSFAFGAPYAVVDGNVQRLLSRFFGIKVPIDSSQGKKLFNDLAESLLYKNDPGRYNQAIMDFGATVCKPAPNCSICPIQKKCIAFANKEVLQLPIKNKKLKIKKRWFYYFIVRAEGKLAVRKRPEGDIWHNLHEFILLESSLKISAQQASAQFFGKVKYSIDQVSEAYVQKLTHQVITGLFIHINIAPKAIPVGVKLQLVASLRKKAFPRLIVNYINKEGLLK